jgi:hypothetical protein
MGSLKRAAGYQQCRPSLVTEGFWWPSDTPLVTALTFQNAGASAMGRCDQSLALLGTRAGGV